ncbi:MAG: site-2 protease family protein [Actinobacteria bacterium]|nr:site-2 protease family protein [Actinomycetota bacterium]
MVILQYVIAVLGLSFIIIIHEFGHYVFAKLSGMHVLEFFMGFGPTVFKWQSRSGTTYGLKAIPVGGYVKILGMDRNEAVPEGLEEKSYHRKSFIKKFLAIAGGPGFNVIISVILIGIFLGMGIYSPTNVIDYVQEDAPAALYGFKPGDRVIALNEKEIETWDEFAGMTKENPGRRVTYTIIRDGKEMDIVAILDEVDGEGYLGISPAYEKKFLDFYELIKESFRMTWEIIVTYIKLFGMLFTGKIPFSQARPVSPIGVISMFQQSVSMGLQDFIIFVALVSILIGFGNLIPLLPLDGGNIVLLVIETIRRKPVPRKVLEVVNSVGIFIMISILIIGLVFDIISPFNINNM